MTQYKRDLSQLTLFACSKDRLGDIFIFAGCSHLTLFTFTFFIYITLHDIFVFAGCSCAWSKQPSENGDTLIQNFFFSSDSGQRTRPHPWMTILRATREPLICDRTADAVHVD